MKRFGAACALALAVIGWTAGCNDYGNTFQAPTGARLSSIAPSNASAGGAAFQLNLFGGGFFAQSLGEWKGQTLPPPSTGGPENNGISLYRTDHASLVQSPRLAHAHN